MQMVLASQTHLEIIYVIVYNVSMDHPWKILLYKTPKGETPVNEFIRSLERNAQSKVYNALELLKAFGISVGPPHIKKLTGKELWELRILGSNNIRIIYIAITSKTFLILHAFKKKKNKTPPKEIKIAEDRLVEFRSRT